MENKVTLTLHDVPHAKVGAILKLWSGKGTTTETEEIEDDETETTTARRAPSNKMGKAGKGKKAAGLNDGDDDIEDDEADEGETEETEGPDYEDVVKAFKAYVNSFEDIKRGRTARVKVLKKFNVEKPDELDEDQYADVIKALKVKKN